MSQAKETITLAATFLLTAGILGGGYYFFTKDKNPEGGQTTPTTTEETINNGVINSGTNNNGGTTNPFAAPSTVPSGTIVSINGSTSMAQFNKAFQQKFQGQFQGTQVLLKAEGSSKGIQDLINGTIDIAAISRPLSPQEQSQGLNAIAVTKDEIAIVVGVNNLFRKSLNQDQIVRIFTGQITNWSEVGGPNQPIRVINRPAVSGTHQVFQELVLKGQNFGTGNNVFTMAKDGTTDIIRELGANGISYATYNQVASQSTALILPVDNQVPSAQSYPYTRDLFYAYKNPPSPGVELFLGFVGSDGGQQLIQQLKQ